jgi:hypothetical protein
MRMMVLEIIPSLKAKKKVKRLKRMLKEKKNEALMVPQQQLPLKKDPTLKRGKTRLCKKHKKL